MTFLITITDNDIDVIASDMQRSIDGKSVQDDFKKIHIYNKFFNPIYIGASGDVGFSNLIFEKLDEIPTMQKNKMTAKDYADKFFSLTNYCYNNGIANRGVESNSYVVMSRNSQLDKNACKFNIFVINTKDNTLNQYNPCCDNNDYVIVLGSFGGLPNDVIWNIVDKHLFPKNINSIKNQIENMITELSKLDKTINDKVDCFNI